MPSASDTAAHQHRIQQTLIAAGVIREVLAVWPRLIDVADINGSWPVLRHVIMNLVRSGRSRSVAAATSYYSRARAIADVPGSFIRVPSTPEFPAEQVATALSVTGPGMLKRSIASGRTPEQAAVAAAATSSQSAGRLVLDAGRQAVEEAVKADPAAIGYARVTDGDPCAWCAMLASRGVVYKTAYAAGRGQELGAVNRFHDGCGCGEKPAFTEEDEPEGAEELYWQWLTVTSGADDPLKTWRKHWRNRLNDTPTLEVGA